jgi:hypothetical protein
MTHRLGSRGFGSLAAIVVGMLIVFILIVLYVRAFAPGNAKGGPPATALDAARKQAQNFEDQQKKRLEQMQEVAQ